jgi:hypothetical protein
LLKVHLKHELAHVDGVGYRIRKSLIWILPPVLSAFYLLWQYRHTSLARAQAGILSMTEVHLF